MFDIASNIKKYRKGKGLRQADLAELLGKSPNVISSWENGVNSPDAPSVEKMLSIFGIDANTLLGWKSPPVSDDEKLIDAIRQTSFGIRDGKETPYDLLSEENKKIIDANISFLLSRQETKKESV